MKFVSIWSYDNYIPAHIASGTLEEQGIKTWLKDENTVTMDPVLSIAVGGIKLMVAETDAVRALDILKKLETNHKSTTPCPKCGSINIEQIGSIRRPANWIMAIFSFLTVSYPMPAEIIYHCFDCGTEYEVPEEKEGSPI